MGKELFRQQVVSLDSRVNILSVNTDRDTHEHVLGTFGDLAIDLEQIRSLERLEAKEVVVEITIVDDRRVEAILVLDDGIVGVLGNHGRVFAGLWVDVVEQIGSNGRELFLCLLVKIRNGDTGGQLGIVGMLGREVGRGFGSQIVEFDGCDALVDALDDLASKYYVNSDKGAHLLGNHSRIDVVHIQSVAELVDTRGDLIESHTFFASIWQ